MDTQVTTIEVKKTNDEILRELLNKRKEIKDKQSTLDDESNEFEVLENERSNINKEINKLKTLMESDKLKAQHEENLRAHLSTVYSFIDEIRKNERIVFTHPNVDERSQEIKYLIKESDKIVNDLKESLLTSLSNEFNNVKRQVLVPMGTTGAQLSKATSSTTNGEDKKDTKQSQLIELMKIGKTNDDLLKMGFVDGTIRFARYTYNKELKKQQAAK